MIILVAGLFVLFLLIPFTLPFFAISGYDGPVAQIVDIDHTYDEEFIGSGLGEYINPTEAAVYPMTTDLLDIITPCGLRMEIMGIPNVLSSEIIDEITEIILDPEAGTNTTKIWEVQKVKCSMSATITTYGGGLADIWGDVEFWIQVNDNSLNSMFSTADENFAYIPNIYTRTQAVTEGHMNVVPTAGSYDFDRTSVDEEETPQWIIDGGYSSNVGKYRTVKFPLKVLSAVPLFGGIPPMRTESYTTFDIGIDILLFGYWEQTKDYREWEWPELPDFWGDLLAGLIFFGWYIVGFVGSIVVIRFIRDPRGIAILLGILWFIVLWQTGFLAGILVQLGLGV